MEDISCIYIDRLADPQVIAMLARRKIRYFLSGCTILISMLISFLVFLTVEYKFYPIIDKYRRIVILFVQLIGVLFQSVTLLTYLMRRYRRNYSAVLLSVHSSSLSQSCTLTVAIEHGQWAKLLCTFFTGVDISVHHITTNSETPEQAAPDYDTLLWLFGTILSTQSFNLKTTVMKSQSYRYCPRLTLATDDQNRFFFSKPGFRTVCSNRHHAESQLLRFLKEKGELKTVKFINVSYSPCPRCKCEFIAAFKDRPDKPTINFLWVHGKGSPLQEDKRYIRAIISLKDLDRAGFKLGLWDGMNFRKFLKDNASKPDHILLAATLYLFAEQIDERAKITEMAIQTVKNYDKCNY